MSLNITQIRNYLQEYQLSCSDETSEKFVGKSQNGGYYHCDSMNNYPTGIDDDPYDKNDNKSEIKLYGVTNLCSMLLGLQSEENRKSGRSGLKQGNTFHRHVFHQMVCERAPLTSQYRVQSHDGLATGKRILRKREPVANTKIPVPKKKKVNCECYQKFGSRTGPLPNPESKLSKWLLCAKTTLAQLGLKHVASELCIKYGSHATEMDLLCMDPDGLLVNVSWKTGYNKHITRAHETIDQSHNLENLLTADENLKIAASHRLQQLCENHLFEKSVGRELEIRSNLIVYIGSTRNPSKCVRVFHSKSSNVHISNLLGTIKW